MLRTVIGFKPFKRKRIPNPSNTEMQSFWTNWNQPLLDRIIRIRGIEGFYPQPEQKRVI